MHVGEMIALLRVVRRLTQVELAKKAGVSQAVLSKAESGLVDLEETRLAAVAAALEVPISRLTHGAPAEGVLSACAFHRKRSSLAVSDAKRIRALLDLTRLQVEGLVPSEHAPVTVPRESPTSDGYTTAGEIARKVRTAMSAPDGPLPDLAGAIESMGAIVVVRDLEAGKIDAIGSWPEGHGPLFLLNSTVPGDRQRFTLAHELGHAVMHPVPTTEQEREADEFASELLMPTTVIRDELSGVKLADLARLKARWGVSMAALARKARDLGMISEYDYKTLNIEMSKAGYRTREPVHIAHESPALVARCIHRALDSVQDISALAASVHLRPEEFGSLYLEEAS